MLPADESAQVSIQWLGHSCFYVHSPGGNTVVTDPFDARATGLASPATSGHLVTLSRSGPEHGFANAVRAFQGETRQVLHGEPAQRGDLRLTAIPLPGGAGTGYLIEAGPLRILHLGGLTQALAVDQVKALGRIDFLMLPVGEDLDPKTAVAVAKAVNPRVVLPMAYATPDMPGVRLRSLDAFVAASPYAVTRKDSDIILVGPGDLPPSTEIWTLQYRR